MSNNHSQLIQLLNTNQPSEAVNELRQMIEEALGSDKAKRKEAQTDDALEALIYTEALITMQERYQKAIREMLDMLDEVKLLEAKLEVL